MLALFFVSVLIASASAQDRLQGEPSVAASGPGYDVNLGYIFHSLMIPGADRVTLYGLNAGGDMDFSRRWAATLETNYIRTSNVSGTELGGNVASLLAGPVFYAVQERDTRLFVHVLAGIALADGTASAGDGQSRVWTRWFSHALGGGIEQSLPKRFAVRVNLDSVGRPYAGTPDIVGTVSLVYRLQPRIH